MAVNIFQDEALDLFALLHKHNVRFLLVGGFAVNYYGYSRTTGDVDLWLEDTLENRKKLIAGLTDYGIVGAGGLLEHPLIAGFSEILLDNGIYLDLMNALQFFGQEQFSECYIKSERFVTDNGVEVQIIHIADLIEEKKRSLRPKDREDASELEKIINSPNKNS
jgi:predicted nucleotidyltransferase